MASQQSHTEEQGHGEHSSMSKKRIWQVFFVLLGITSIEFFIALVLLPREIIGHGLGNFSYIVLTLLKAYYIIGYFMHLKFEKSVLISCIIVPLIFIVYFIVLILTEGSYLQLHMHH